MGFPRKKVGKQGKWPQALGLFATPLLLVFIFRWMLYEPFVIPSESMMPNLLVHDHIIVEKFSYGIKSPFGDGWLFKWIEPKRGDVVVFRFPENREVYFIKRLIGLPGDHIKVQNGQITINNKPWMLQPIGKEVYNDEDDFTYYIEMIPLESISNEEDHLVRFYSSQNHVDPVEKEFIVPAGSYFMMGDNRDQSHDSRFWGFVDEKYLIGKATRIWLSCEDTIPTAPMICDPLKLRTDRIFKKVGQL
jgi:signal peptidase I